MTVSPEDRRHLEERIAEVTDERAARTMSELFDEDDEDPGILARFDQQDAMLAEHGRRLDRIERRLEAHDARFDRIDEQFGQIDARFDRIDARAAVVNDRFDQLAELLDVKLDAMRYEVLSTFRGDIQHAVNGQWRTMIVGMGTLGVVLVASAAALAQLIA